MDLFGGKWNIYDYLIGKQANWFDYTFPVTAKCTCNIITSGNFHNEMIKINDVNFHW